MRGDLRTPDRPDGRGGGVFPWGPTIKKNFLRRGQCWGRCWSPSSPTLSPVSSDISLPTKPLLDTAIAALWIICSPILSCFASCAKTMDSLTNECYGFLCFIGWIQLRSKSLDLDGATDLYWMKYQLNLFAEVNLNKKVIFANLFRTLPLSHFE